MVIKNANTGHQAAPLEAAERRATSRLKTNALGSITNVTSGAGRATVVVLDISGAGIRIRTVLDVSPGDAVLIELSDLTLLAEAIYREHTPEDVVIGLKLFHSLAHDDLVRCVEPSIWLESF